MSRVFVAIWCGLFAFITSAACAQTSYPMVMSLKPTAAQVGTTSEHTVHSRYNMFGAFQVIVAGKGVSGEVVSPEVKDPKKPPSVTKLKVRFTVAADAMTGVRDFRLITPRGASTLGQLVVAGDKVIAETGDNNTSEKAQAISIPATVCGAFEKAEDVDVFKFKAQAGQSLSFHVRSMRLEDRIHDLQTHSDPIITLKTLTGATLVQADNFYAADPFLSHRFEKEGEYLLEIRDVRYHGNVHWVYSIEISDKPFVAVVHPLGISAGRKTAMKLFGVQLPAEAVSTLSLPTDEARGQRWVRLPTGGGLTNPVNVVVSDLPTLIEADGDNNRPEKAQAISVPAGISGRIEAESDIDCYTFESRKGEKFSFEVVARRAGSPIDSVLRILDAQGKRLAEQDDMSHFKRNYTDSHLENWSAPADGKYTVEIRDLEFRGGPAFVYFLKVTRSHPYFVLYLDTDKTQLTPGTSGVIFVQVTRKNGFKGAVKLHIDGLPQGVTASCESVPAGVSHGSIILTAAADASMKAANITVTGKATHKLNDKKTLELKTSAVSRQETYMPGGGRNHWHVDMHTVAVGAPGDIRTVKLSTYDVTLKPGESKRIDISIERSANFNKNITLDMLFQHLGGVFGNTLPPGVSIDSNNSKTLLTGKETKGHITIKAAPKAKPSSKRQVSVMANISLNFVMKSTYSASPLWVEVAKP